MNPYELRADSQRALNQLHNGERDYGRTCETLIALIDRGLEIGVITADIESRVRLCQDERRAAAAHQKSLMLLHAFAQGYSWRRRDTK